MVDAKIQLSVPQVLCLLLLLLLLPNLTPLLLRGTFRLVAILSPQPPLGRKGEMDARLLGILLYPVMLVDLRDGGGGGGGGRM